MVGHIPLEDGIGVRVPDPQHWKSIICYNQFMKKLIILIVILIALWLVLRERAPEPVVEEEQQVMKLGDGHQCYTYSHEKTETEPYDVSEFIDLTINGMGVTGTKTGTQEGPDMHNGYSGTLTGTLDKNKNTIEVLFSYIIEGSHNEEREVYRGSLV